MICWKQGCETYLQKRCNRESDVEFCCVLWVLFETCTWRRDVGMLTSTLFVRFEQVTGSQTSLRSVFNQLHGTVVWTWFCPRRSSCPATIRNERAAFFYFCVIVLLVFVYDHFPFLWSDRSFCVHQSCFTLCSIATHCISIDVQHTYKYWVVALVLNASPSRQNQNRESTWSMEASVLFCREKRFEYLFFLSLHKAIDRGHKHGQQSGSIRLAVEEWIQ